MITEESKSASFEVLAYHYTPDHGDHTVGIVRVHPPGGSYKNKSPYSWAATAECFSTTTERKNNIAYIYGATKAPTPSEWRALYRLFKSVGVNIVSYERAKGKNVCCTIE